MAVLFSDNFIRADASVPGNGWNVASAGSGYSSGISTNRGYFTGNNNGGQFWYRSDITPDKNIYIEVEFTIPSSWFTRCIGIKNSNTYQPLGYGVNLDTAANTLNIVDNGIAKTTGSFTWNTTDHFRIRIEINNGYHMDVYAWNATSGSKPATPTISFTNGGAAYTPSAPGTNWTINFESNIAGSATTYVYAYEVGDLSAAYTKTLTETATVIDSLVRSITRTLSEAPVVSDALTAIKIISATFSEAIAATDTLIRSITRSLFETATAIDSIVRSITRILSDAAAAADALTRSITRTLTESINPIDIIKKFLNGLGVIWTKRSRNASSFANRPRNSSTWTNRDRDAL